MNKIYSTFWDYFRSLTFYVTSNNQQSFLVHFKILTGYYYHFFLEILESNKHFFLFNPSWAGICWLIGRSPTGLAGPSWPGWPASQHRTGSVRWTNRSTRSHFSPFFPFLALEPRDAATPPPCSDRSPAKLRHRRGGAWFRLNVIYLALCSDLLFVLSLAHPLTPMSPRVAGAVPAGLGIPLCFSTWPATSTRCGLA
jgi:hypothetical protein